jgi:hypothetical protein
MAAPSAGQPGPGDDGEAGIADAVREVFAEAFGPVDPSHLFRKDPPAHMPGVFAGLGGERFVYPDDPEDDVPPYSYPPVWPSPGGVGGLDL